MELRAILPIDGQAASGASQALYRRYETWPRPNRLFDREGNRRVPAADEPANRGLQQEWLRLYESNGGRVEQHPVQDQAVGEIAAPCRGALLLLTDLTPEEVFDGDDAFELTATAGRQSFAQQRSSQMDRIVSEGNYIQLAFRDLPLNETFTLRVRLQSGQEISLFEDVTYAALSGMAGRRGPY